MGGGCSRLVTGVLVYVVLSCKCKGLQPICYDCSCAAVGAGPRQLGAVQVWCHHVAHGGAASMMLTAKSPLTVRSGEVGRVVVQQGHTGTGCEWSPLHGLLHTVTAV